MSVGLVWKNCYIIETVAQFVDLLCGSTVWLISKCCIIMRLIGTLEEHQAQKCDTKLLEK